MFFEKSCTQHLIMMLPSQFLKIKKKLKTRKEKKSASKDCAVDEAELC